MTQATTGTMAPDTRTTLRPLHDRVLVQPLEAPDEHGRILIPDMAREKPHEGRVVAVGPGRVTKGGQHRPLAVKQGDRILFGKYSGSELRLNGEELLIMKEEDVLGVLEGRHA
jgi:chaperonin GroES